MERIDEETAQVILIGGFLIAIGVVSAVLILNDISYSQTIASQNGNSGDFGPTEFADSAERAVSEAMTGNGSDPEGARDHFEAYIQSYSKGANGLLSDEGVSANASVSVSAINEAWMVGQRRTGDFTNATGGEQWVLAEDNLGGIDDTNNPKMKFNLSINQMSSDRFVLNATDSSTDIPLDAFQPITSGWRLDMWEDSGDLRVEYRELPSGSTTSDSTTVGDFAEVDLLNGTVDDTNNNALQQITSTGVSALRFENASYGHGTYDLRLNENAGVGTANIGGPCNIGPPCRSADGTEKHIVGVVHSIASDAVELNYFGRSTTYSKDIGNMNLDADDVDLNETVNVEGTSYFDVEITTNNSPVVEGDDIEIGYEVENKGSVEDDQTIRLFVNGTEEDTDRAPTSGKLTGGFYSNTTADPLTWNTDPGENGTYTAYVLSENTTDTVSVSVDKDNGGSREPAIPSGPVGFGLPSFGLETLAGVTQR